MGPQALVSSIMKENESTAESVEGVSRQQLGLAVIWGKFLLDGPLSGLVGENDLKV